MIDVSTCPTCARPYDVPTDPGPCDVVWPPSARDVLPVRCTGDAGHGEHHSHPPLWPGTPAVTWTLDPADG